MDAHEPYPLWSYVNLVPMIGLQLESQILRFGCRESQVLAALGPPDSARQNYDGEVELLYGGGIFRLLNEQFVECTFPDTAQQRVRLYVGDTPVLSLYQWLGAAPDAVDVARFRVSRANGIAYDARGPEHASFTLFAPGHWDALLAPLIDRR